MNNYVLSTEAEAYLNDATLRYRKHILSKIVFDSSDNKQIVSLEDMKYAVSSFEKQQQFSNNRLQESIKLRNFLVLICYIVALIASLLTLFTSFVGNESIIITTELVKLISYTCSVLLMISMLMIYFVTYKTRKNSKQSKKIAEFLDKWRVFENLLRQVYTDDKHKEPSFIDLMSNYLHEFDETYIDKPKDFRYALKIRNEIVHGDVKEQISIEKLEKAIETLNKLIPDVRKMQNGSTL